MSPALEKGERVVYEKRVDPARLRRGTVIMYRLSHRSLWGEPGSLTIARILAVPGDQLSIQNGKYLVNGEVGQTVAGTGQYAPELEVTSMPEALTLADHRFFVVQEAPTRGLDSRVLSWVESAEVVSTRLYLLSGRGVFRPVE